MTRLLGLGDDTARARKLASIDDLMAITYIDVIQNITFVTQHSVSEVVQWRVPWVLYMGR